MKKIVKNGTVVTDSQVFQADILIEDEKVKMIGGQPGGGRGRSDRRVRKICVPGRSRRTYSHGSSGRKIPGGGRFL